MRFKFRPPPLLTAILVGFVLFSSVSACTRDQSPITRVLNALYNKDTQLPEATLQELKAFVDVYNRYAKNPEDLDKLNYFKYAFSRVRRSYVRSVNDRDLVNNAIKGIEKSKPLAGGVENAVLIENALSTMVASLDPHSSFMNARAFQESFVQTRGEFGGLGIEVTMEDGFVKVVSPIEDTPASRAGLKSGDLITHVDGDVVQGKTLAEAVRTMRGRPGEGIKLRIRREGVDDFDVELIRAIITVRAVKWRKIDDIGYIRVSRFNEQMEDGIIRAFRELRQQPGKKLNGFVLDLRNNPGGLLTQSLKLSDAFLNDGEIVSVRGRDASDNRSFFAENGDLALGLPVVVLVNAGSASASEIVASALQQNNRAIVMGARTFGKGSVQTITPLPVEGGLRLTTALYYAPSGQTIQARGVVPDIIVTPVEKIKARHESDLPGAIPAKSTKLEKNSPNVVETKCPIIEDKKDYLLGCAIAYFDAGTTAKFLASYAQNNQNM